MGSGLQGWLLVVQDQSLGGLRALEYCLTVRVLDDRDGRVWPWIGWCVYQKCMLWGVLCWPRK